MPSRYIPPALRGATPSDESTPSDSAANNSTAKETEVNNQARRLSDLNLKSSSRNSHDNKSRGRGSDRSRGRGRGRGGPSFFRNGNDKRDFQDVDDGRKTGMRTIDEIHEHYWPSRLWSKRSTLNDSGNRPGELAYIILFQGANPRWAGEKIIFAKTNIDYLPRGVTADNGGDENGSATGKENKGGDESEQTGAPSSGETPKSKKVLTGEDPTSSDLIIHTSESNDETPAQLKLGRHISQDIRLEEEKQEPPPIVSTNPIAVFEQIRGNQSGRSFRFKDWYLLSRLDFLPPQSPGLVRMLQQKWDKKDRWGQPRDQERHEAAWQASLSVEWAVVKMIQENQGREKPEIPVHEKEDFTDGGEPFGQDGISGTNLEAIDRGKQGESTKDESDTVDHGNIGEDAAHQSEDVQENQENIGRS